MCLGYIPNETYAAQFSTSTTTKACTNVTHCKQPAPSNLLPQPSQAIVLAPLFRVPTSTTRQSFPPSMPSSQAHPLQHNGAPTSLFAMVTRRTNNRRRRP
eukprot:m.180221 g.180221  ORF g.180221 m.180221 type:complete len:100 (-) comp14944_c1_seq3:1541-1840(-)